MEPSDAGPNGRLHDEGEDMSYVILGSGVILLIIIVVIIGMGIRIVRPTHRGLVERLGKYNRYAGPGFHVIIPGIEKMYKVDIREVLVEAQQQVIITNDNLNARVDAQVYLKVKADEESVKASLYNVIELPEPDRQSGADDAAQHHRHADAQVGQQRARQDQQRAAQHPARSRRRVGASRSCAPSSRRSTRRRTCRRR